MLSFFKGVGVYSFFLVFFSCFSHAEKASNSSVEMNNLRLHKIINKIDKEAKGDSGYWEFSLEGIRLTVVTDERADRMRIISPIVQTESLEKKELYRLMQANFDSALDARYAIAKGVLWATFIHPLASLGDQEFLMGVGQTVNIVESYGSSYSSGGLVFEGGDSSELQKSLLERLKKIGDMI